MVSYISIVDMIKALNRCENDYDFIDLWNAFVTMHDAGFISSKDWASFREFAKGLLDVLTRE